MTVATRRARHVVVVDNSAIARKVGERIRTARVAAGLTQAQLAGDRYTAAYISALERGLAKPSLASMVYLGPRLGLRLQDLIGEDAPALPNPTVPPGRLQEAMQRAWHLCDRPAPLGSDDAWSGFAHAVAAYLDRARADE